MATQASVAVRDEPTERGWAWGFRTVDAVGGQGSRGGGEVDIVDLFSAELRIRG